LVSLSYGNISLFASFIRPKNWEEGKMDLSIATFPFQMLIESKALVKEIKIKADEFPSKLEDAEYGY